MFVSGYSGAGKSTLLLNYARYLIDQGKGVAVFDLHGGLNNDLLHCISRERFEAGDVIWLDASEGNVELSLTEYDPGNHQKVGHLVDAFSSIYPMDHYSALLLRYCLIVHSYVERSTIRGVLHMLRNPKYLKQIVKFCKDDEARQFFRMDYPKWEKLYRFRADREGPIKTAIGDLMSHPGLKRMFGNSKSKLNMRRVLDDKMILLISIPRGKLDDRTAGITGALLLGMLKSAAFSRIDIPKEEDRSDFYGLLDECHLIASPQIIASNLSGARAFGLYLACAMQYADQAEAVAKAALANAQIKITWRPSGAAMEKEFKGLPFQTMNEDAERLGYRNAVAVKEGEYEFTGYPLDRQMPDLFEQLTRYARPEQIKNYSKLRFSPTK
jgi:hypothetical protein